MLPTFTTLPKCRAPLFASEAHCDGWRPILSCRYLAYCGSFLTFLQTSAGVLTAGLNVLSVGTLLLAASAELAENMKIAAKTIRKVLRRFMAFSSVLL